MTAAPASAEGEIGMRFRKKPVEIEARQLDSENLWAIAAWCRGTVIGPRAIEIKTLEGKMRASGGLDKTVTRTSSQPWMHSNLSWMVSRPCRSRRSGRSRKPAPQTTGQRPSLRLPPRSFAGIMTTPRFSRHLSRHLSRKGGSDE